MAKFAIAVYIVLVAVAYGVQDSTFTKIMDKLTSLVTSYITNGQSRIKLIEENITNATNAAATLEQLVNSTIQNATTEYKKIIASISANGTRDVSKCISLSIDFEHTAVKLSSNTVACVENTIGKVLSNSHTTVIEFEDAVSALNEIAKNAISCGTNNETSVACITSIWNSVENGTSSSWIKLLSNATSLLAEYTELQNSIQFCGVTATSATLEKEAQKSYNSINKCIANLNSTTS